MRARCERDAGWQSSASVARRARAGRTRWASSGARNVLSASTSIEVCTQCERDAGWQSSARVARRARAGRTRWASAGVINIPAASTSIEVRARFARDAGWQSSAHVARRVLAPRTRWASSGVKTYRLRRRASRCVRDASVMRDGSRQHVSRDAHEWHARFGVVRRERHTTCGDEHRGVVYAVRA